MTPRCWRHRLFIKSHTTRKCALSAFVHIWMNASSNIIIKLVHRNKSTVDCHKCTIPMTCPSPNRGECVLLV
jgi:hypothetical protein